MAGESRRLCLNLTPSAAADTDALPALLAEAKAQGFTTVMLTCAWYLCERAPLRYAFRYYDRRIAMIRDAGMDVILHVDLRRTTHIFDGERVCTDTVITTDEFFRGDKAQNPADSAEDEVICISLASGKATGCAVRFFRDAVKHFCDTFGDCIYAVLPTFSPEGNSEYPADAMDVSLSMLRAYRNDLPLSYRTTAELNHDLHTHFPAFGAAELPSADDRGPAGMLYYRCRHELLLDFIERLAGAKRLSAPWVRFAVRFGSVTDASAANRCTYAFGALGACADLVIIGEGREQDIAFTADYAASTFAYPGSMTRFGLSGVAAETAGEAVCAERIMTAYRHNAALVCLDSIREDNGITRAADAYLRAQAPFCVSENVREGQPLAMSLGKLFETGDGLYYTDYYKLYTDNGVSFGRVTAVDDLTACILPNSIAAKRQAQAKSAKTPSLFAKVFGSRAGGENGTAAKAAIAAAALVIAVGAAAYLLQSDDD